LSTALLLLGTMLMLSYKIYQDAASTEGGQILSIQYGAVLVTTTFCYLLGAWKIERDYIKATRNCNGIYATLEWMLRTLILVFIGIAALFFSGIFSLFGLPPIAAGLTFLATCSFLFLLWDAVMSLGGNTHVAWKFFPLDIFGALAVFVSLFSYLAGHSTTIKAFTAILVLVYAFSSVVAFREEFQLMMVSIVSKNNRR